MLSINTNISSIIAQQSMSSATNKLNQAIERMTTGYKINSAKDNAANYSISTNMSTKINSYDIAGENVAMGMDLVRTADDILSTMQDKAARLQALCTQAQNDTNGAQSLLALNTEAQAILAEIDRIYNTAEYNGVNLFSRKAYDIADHLPQAGESGFIDETGVNITELEAKAEYNGFIEDPKTYTDAEVAAMTRVKDVSTFTSGQKYAIYTKDELVKLADYVNSGKQAYGVEFVLGADIDLSSIENWTPIGDLSTNYNDTFAGTFDGNGHIIKNLTINNNSTDRQGLFGYTESSSVIQNIGLVNVNINGRDITGALVGTSNGTINNSYATGSVNGREYVGGLIGISVDIISNSYATCDVIAKTAVGGLTGRTVSDITNSFATGNVTSSSNYVGGLIGEGYGQVRNSYATGNIRGAEYAGGLAGSLEGDIYSSYATGDVNGTNRVGGLAGFCYVINNSYAIGNVSGQERVGGLTATAENITNSFATGNVSGNNYVGGLAGSTSSGTITNSYANNTVNGQARVGGLIGAASNNNIINSFANSSVNGQSRVGGLVGSASNSDITNSYTTKSTNGDNMVGGLIGSFTNATISDSVAYSQVTGNTNTGALIGYVNDSGNFDLNNVKILNTNILIIGNYYDNTTGASNPTKGLEFASLVTIIPLKQTSTTLQVGISGNSSSQINFDTNFSFDLKILKKGIETDEAKEAIFEFTNLLSEKATKLGAIENRLDSALDSITVTTENLTSSLSTIRDADISEVTSEYIRQQILQQASATLLATANQNPSIALQLI